MIKWNDSELTLLALAYAAKRFVAGHPNYPPEYVNRVTAETRALTVELYDKVRSLVAWRFFSAGALTLGAPLGAGVKTATDPDAVTTALDIMFGRADVQQWLADKVVYKRRECIPPTGCLTDDHQYNWGRIIAAGVGFAGLVEVQPSTTITETVKTTETPTCVTTVTTVTTTHVEPMPLLKDVAVTLKHQSSKAVLVLTTVAGGECQFTLPMAIWRWDRPVYTTLDDAINHLLTYTACVDRRWVVTNFDED